MLIRPIGPSDVKSVERLEKSSESRSVSGDIIWDSEKQCILGVTLENGGVARKDYRKSWKGGTQLGKVVCNRNGFGNEWEMNGI